MSFTEAELIERRSHLGASEAASSAGCSPYFSRLDLYKSKIGEGEPIEETLPMKVGMALEPVVLDAFEKETGWKVVNRQKRVEDRAWSVRRATLDGTVHDGTQHALVEAKTSGDWQGWGKAEDEIPIQYIYQVHHQFMCTGLTVAYVPVILSQRSFKIYRIDRDPVIVDLLNAAQIRFWELVMQRTPPPAENVEDLKYLYPRDTGQDIQATTDIEKTVRALAILKAQIKDLENPKGQLELAVRTFMEDKATLVSASGKVLATYKANAERRLDVTQFKIDHPGMAEAYSPESWVRKLLIKVKG